MELELSFKTSCLISQKSRLLLLDQGRVQLFTLGQEALSIIYEISSVLVYGGKFMLVTDQLTILNPRKGIPSLLQKGIPSLAAARLQR